MSVLQGIKTKWKTEVILKVTCVLIFHCWDGQMVVFIINHLKLKIMETKFRIVETEEYFLAVSDEDASNSYIYFTGDPTGIFRTGIKYKNGAGDYFYQDAITGMSDTYLTTISKKIIGYQPKGNAPELDLPLLPDVEPRGFDEFEYTEDDLRKAFEVGRNFQLTGENNFNELLLYLKRPKWFVAEMKHTKSEVFRENDNVPYVVLKTTTINNKIYLEGTYLN